MFKLLAIIGTILIFWNLVKYVPGILTAVFILGILIFLLWLLGSKGEEIQSKSRTELRRERKAEEERIRAVNKRIKAKEERIRIEKMITYGHDITIEERED